MRIHTATTWQMTDVIGEDVLVSDVWYEYAGPIAEAKKGRKEQEQLAAFQRQQMEQEAARRAAQQAAMEPTIAAFEGMSGPGGISPYAQGQYATDLDNIGNTYSSLRRAALKSLGPQRDERASGLALTKMNALDQSRGMDETAAFRNALANTLDLRKYALGVRGEQAADSGRQSLGSGNLASEALLRRSQMGSAFGDVLGGIGQVAGIASDLFMPGSGLLRQGAKSASGVLKGLPLGRTNTSYLNPLITPGRR